MNIFHTGGTGFIGFRETAHAGSANFAHASAKAKAALGWNPQPPREVWLDTLRVERQLSTRRKTRKLQTLLRPLGVGA